MKINRNNYEAFFLDYHEGNLSDELKKELFAFLDSNLELKEEFENFEIISLVAQSEETFSGKEKLKKGTITIYNYKTWFVAYEENDLNADEKKEVERFIEINPGYKPELEILKQTRILPDYTIRLANKSSLKKGRALIPMWVRVAAAACLTMVLLSYLFISSNRNEKQFADGKNANNIAAESVPTIRDSQIENQTAGEIKPIIADGKELESKNKSHIKRQNSLKKNVVVKKIEGNLASNDSTRAIQKEIVKDEQPLAIQHQTSNLNPQTDSSPTIIIAQNLPAAESKPFVVLDDNDLAELGLKPKVKVEDNSILANAVNNVGKLFNVNAHYEKEHNLQKSNYTETLALGPIGFSRTVPR